MQKPKVLVLETYAINESDPLRLEKGALNDEINSFRARRDTWLKVRSTPSLFNYPGPQGYLAESQLHSLALQLPQLADSLVRDFPQPQLHLHQAGPGDAQPQGRGT